MLLCRDISHRYYIKELLNYNKEKSKMISYVSHEYRTPLSCIILMIEQALEVEDRQNLFKLLTYALSNAKYLLYLSNDLLDFA